MAYNPSNNEDVGTFEVSGNVVITESTDGVEEGYKEVKMVSIEDVNANTSYRVEGRVGYRNWHSAFDRYTGTSFEFDPISPPLYPGQSENKEGFATIVNGDTSYNVSISFGSVNEGPIITSTVTVTCPVNYDGVVFQIGYFDQASVDTFGAIDFAERLYTIDELPNFGDENYYFSYSNE